MLSEQQADRQLRAIRQEKAELKEKLENAIKIYRAKKLDDERLINLAQKSNKKSNICILLGLVIIAILAPWWITALALVPAYYLNDSIDKNYVKFYNDLAAEFNLLAKQVDYYGNKVQALEDKEHAILRNLGIDADWNE